jgi:hypothetical protein
VRVRSSTSSWRASISPRRLARSIGGATAATPGVATFGLLGLTGLFDHFDVTIASYAEWFQLTPI